MVQPYLALAPATWIRIKDGDPTGLELYRRHYSARPGRRRQAQFVGPGRSVVLVTPAASALFVWRRFEFDRAGQTGVNAAVFRNEGDEMASDLIRAAELEARGVWPDERLYTYIDPRYVRPTMVRGYPVFGWCFYKAGWTFAGVTKDCRLHILERDATEGRK